MSLPEIPLDLAHQLKDNLASGDIAKIETSYKSGGLDWLKGHLSAADWVELPKRIIARDLAWIRQLLGGLNLPGVGKLFGGSSYDAAADATTTTANLAASEGSGIGGKLGGTAAAAAGGLGIVALAKTLMDKIGGKDIDFNWLSSEHKAGKLDWLKSHLSPADWTEFPKRIASRDASWIRSVFSRIELPGIGKLFAGGAAAVAAGGVAAAAMGDRAKGAATSAKGAVSSSGTSTVTKVAVEETKRKGGMAWWKWLLPLLILAGLLIWALSKCGGSTATSSTTTAAPVTTVASATTAPATTAPATTVAPATTAAAPATTAPATTVAPATTAAATTTAAPATTAAAPATTIASAAGGDMLSLLSSGKYSTFAKLLGDAGLADSLKGAGPYTLFAPTDEAFAKLPKATLDALAANKDLLKQVLNNHIVAGSLKAADLKAGDLKTLNGTSITLTINGTKITIGGANVLSADGAAKNGVLHSIDAVILPAGVPPAPAAAGAATTTTVAATKSTLVGTL